MVLVTIKESAAATAVGTNLTANTRIFTSGKHRYVRRIGVVGSSAVGNAAVQLFYGNRFIGEFQNTTSGANVIAVDAKDFITLPPTVINQAGEPLLVLISTASATNILAVTLDVVELG